jgi:hypothetical protein
MCGIWWACRSPPRCLFCRSSERGPRLDYRLKLTLLPLTFPDDDAPEGGQLHNRIVDEKPANILWIAMASENWARHTSVGYHFGSFGSSWQHSFGASHFLLPSG